MEKLKVKEVLKLIYDFDEDHYVISGGASGKNIKKLAERIVELILKLLTRVNSTM
jgi:hypothetical protein